MVSYFHTNPYILLADNFEASAQTETPAAKQPGFHSPNGRFVALGLPH
jgi:hypothetical protein